MLTFEHNPDAEELEIFLDHEGLDLLMRKLQTVKDKGGHVHLMTPAWAGNELSEEIQRPGNTLINHVRVTLIRP